MKHDHGKYDDHDANAPRDTRAATRTSMRVLHDAVREIGMLIDEQEIARRTAEKAAAVLSGPVVVLVEGAEPDRFVSLGVAGGTEAPPLPAAVPPHCLVHYGHALGVHEIVGASAAARAAYREFSFAPLEADGRAFGLLGVKALLDSEATELFCALAGVASVAIARARARNAAVLEETRRRQLSRYFSPAVVEHLVAHAGHRERHAHRLDATVLFSDVRGFTSISESRDPSQIMELLNAYFDPMVTLVFEHGGMLDKLIGDGLMAVFGAPDERPDHADAALACARAMVAKARALDVKRFGLDSLTIGVGLHSGPVILGDLGADSFLDFTVLGSTVNVASRVESLTKELGAPIALTAAVKARLTRHVALEPAGPTHVRGIEGPIELYRVAAD